MKDGSSLMVFPQKIVEGNIKAAEGKASMPFWRMVLLGILAGMFIAGGAAASNVAMHAVGNVGLARFIGGCIFPVGLMMIVFIGGELFTGDCMMIIGCIHKRYTTITMLRVLAIVWLTNLIGAVAVAAMAYGSGQYDYTSGLLGAYTIKVALTKVSVSFPAAFISGIMCNIFVCAAVLMASAAKDIAGKVWAIFFPIMAFVVSGYEHCVANMYYVPAGIFALGDNTYKLVAIEQYGYTLNELNKLNWGNYFLHSAIPVTLGNIVGGMVFVAVPLYIIHRKSIMKSEAGNTSD